MIKSACMYYDCKALERRYVDKTKQWVCSGRSRAFGLFLALMLWYVGSSAVVTRFSLRRFCVTFLRDLIHRVIRGQVPPSMCSRATPPIRSAVTPCCFRLDPIMAEESHLSTQHQSGHLDLSMSRHTSLWPLSHTHSVTNNSPHLQPSNEKSKRIHGHRAHAGVIVTSIKQMCQKSLKRHLNFKTT